MKSGSAHCNLEFGEEAEEETAEAEAAEAAEAAGVAEAAGDASLIKSSNPHLAGGEKNNPVLHGPVNWLEHSCDTMSSFDYVNAGFSNLELSLALDDGCCRVQEALGIGCTPGLEDYQSNRLAQCEKVYAQ